MRICSCRLRLAVSFSDAKIRCFSCPAKVFFLYRERISLNAKGNPLSCYNEHLLYSLSLYDASTSNIMRQKKRQKRLLRLSESDGRDSRSGHCGYQKAMAETAEAVTMSIIPKGRLRHFGLRLMLASGVTTCLPLSCCIYLLAATADYYSARCGRSGLA